MRKICYVSSRLCKNAKKSFMYIKNAENTTFWPIQLCHLTFLFMRIETRPNQGKLQKQVVWIILRNRIFHGTIRHISSGFPLYARTLCALTLPAYALNSLKSKRIIKKLEKKMCFHAVIPLSLGSNLPVVYKNDNPNF